MKTCVCYVTIIALGVLPLIGWGNTGLIPTSDQNPVALWATSTIHGTLFEDLNKDKYFDDGDVVLQGIGIEAYQDLNYNGEIDSEDAFITNGVSGEDGYYFLEVSPANLSHNYKSVSLSSDDATEDIVGGAIQLDGEYTTNAQEAGYRFDNLDIPQNAVILSATLTLTPVAHNTGTTHMSINAELTDNAATFSNQAFDIQDRARTENTLDWTTTMPVTAESPVSVDGLESIISEITSRQGWEAGNAIALMLSNCNLNLFTFDGGFAPNLNITYVPEGTTDVHYLVRPVQSDLPEEFGGANTSIVETTVFEDIAHVTRDFGFISGAIVLAEENNVFIHSELNVWPNPTSGPINISLSNEAANKNYKMMVFDMAGKNVEQKNLNVEHNEQLQYDMSSLTKGVYIIGITDGAEMLTHKVILQ